MGGFRPVYSFFAGNLLFIVLVLGTFGILFSKDIKRLLERLLNRKTCPHCGGRMKMEERDGKKYWSCTECQVKVKLRSEKYKHE